jgi:hypothetical protein
MFGDLWLDDVSPQRLKARWRSGFIAADELGVADLVGRHDGGEAALLPHRKPSAAAAGASRPAAIRTGPRAFAALPGDGTRHMALDEFRSYTARRRHGGTLAFSISPRPT